jgi:hypothetical protein
MASIQPGYQACMSDQTTNYQTRPSNSSTISQIRPNPPNLPPDIRDISKEDSNRCRSSIRNHIIGNYGGIGEFGKELQDERSGFRGVPERIWDSGEFYLVATWIVGQFAEIRWVDRLLDRSTTEDGDDTKKMIESLHCYIICIFTTTYSPLY